MSIHVCCIGTQPLVVLARLMTIGMTSHNRLLYCVSLLVQLGTISSNTRYKIVPGYPTNDRDQRLTLYSLNAYTFRRHINIWQQLFLSHAFRIAFDPLTIDCYTGIHGRVQISRLSSQRHNIHFRWPLNRGQCIRTQERREGKNIACPCEMAWWSIDQWRQSLRTMVS